MCGDLSKIIWAAVVIGTTLNTSRNLLYIIAHLAAPFAHFSVFVFFHKKKIDFLGNESKKFCVFLIDCFAALLNILIFQFLCTSFSFNTPQVL